MLTTGLLSVTFRQLEPPDIIRLAAQAGLQAIEWGGDIHAPHGDVQAARAVSRLTREAGLAVASYGSYYRVGAADEDPKRVSFEAALASAEALEAPSIRVWAGQRGSAETDEDGWARTIQDAVRIAELAQRAGVAVDFEFHRNTLTDTRDSAVRLLTSCGHPNLRCHWQPATELAPAERRLDLEAVLPWLANVHVFQWQPGIRLPLAEGADEWRDYIAAVRADGRPHYVMLEFVKDDDPQQFLEDARTLRRLVEAHPA